MTSSAKHLKISELSALTGISIPTIRFYIKEGLMPEPIKTSKTMAYYTQDHVDLLEEIKTLKEQESLSIKDIKSRLKNRIKPAKKAKPETLHTNQREDILNSATHLFREHGYETTSITDIVEHSGIGRGTFYTYFKNKEELFLECSDRVFLEIDKGFSKITEEKNIELKLIKRGLFFFQRFRRIIDMMNQVRGSSWGSKKVYNKKFKQILNNLLDPIIKDISEGIDNGIFRDIDPSLGAHIMVGLADYCSFLYRYGDLLKSSISQDETETFVQYLLSFVFNGINNSITLEKELSSKIRDFHKETRFSSIIIEEKSEEDKRLRQIKVAAINLFKHNGYNNTSVSDIVEKAKVGKGTFYEYFPNKEELFIQCVDMIFYSIYTDVHEPIRNETDIIKRLRKRVFYFIESYPKWIDIMNIIRGGFVGANSNLTEKLSDVLKKITNNIAEDISTAIDNGIMPPVNITIASYIIMGAAEYSAYLYHTGSYDPELFIDSLMDILINGLKGAEI
ncbi:MAG: TetR family transcriptional regulator [bacterium]|nr:TetR family transcriptional regulator [bacterium]